MRSLSKQAGVTLIEVMVSVAILAIGIIGLAGLQARTLMMGQSSYYRAIAADLATNLAERIRANQSPFLATTDSDAQPANPPDFSKCRPASGSISCLSQPTDHESYLVASEMREWYSSLTSQLPEGNFTLVSVAAAASGPAVNRYRYTLTITWLDDRTAVGASTSSSSAASSGASSSASSSSSSSSSGSSSASSSSSSCGAGCYSVVIE